MKEIQYLSTADNTQQPAIFHAPDKSQPTPLLVALHTWSSDYHSDYNCDSARWCVQKGWAYIHPDFRGPNKRPEATGSELVIKDIVSAVDYARQTANIDASRVYLVGASGGGYTALLMAGRQPEIWAAVSAWVPISDLRQWYLQCKLTQRDYYKDIVASCGGAPGDSDAVDLQYRNRSPVTWLAAARNVPLDINAGITDGHSGSVPISHSLEAFNILAEPTDRITTTEIKYFVDCAAVPVHLRKPISDPDYGDNPPLFRRSSGNARVTIFQGGHEIVAQAALTWLQKHRKNKTL